MEVFFGFLLGGEKRSVKFSMVIDIKCAVWIMHLSNMYVISCKHDNTLKYSVYISLI